MLPEILLNRQHKEGGSVCQEKSGAAGKIGRRQAGALGSRKVASAWLKKTHLDETGKVIQMRPKESSR